MKAGSLSRTNNDIVDIVYGGRRYIDWIIKGEMTLISWSVIAKIPPRSHLYYRFLGLWP